MKSQNVFGPVWASYNGMHDLFPHLPPASSEIIDAYLVVLREQLKDLFARELPDAGPLRYEQDPAHPGFIKIFTEAP